MTTTEGNKALVRRKFEEFDPQNPTDTLDHSFFEAFPDYSFTIKEMIAEGDKVVVRGTVRATHLGDWKGLKATGKQAEWSEVHILRVEDNAIRDWWFIVDDQERARQLGFSFLAEG